MARRRCAEPEMAPSRTPARRWPDPRLLLNLAPSEDWEDFVAWCDGGGSGRLVDWRSTGAAG